MPQYRGRSICDWTDDIGELKRQKRYNDALSLAVGCMQAMAEVSTRNPGNVMEFYVVQVAQIQHKLKAYDDEARTIHGWLSQGLPAPRDDYRIDLMKRLAKAREILARRDGQDPAPHHAEWQRLVELAKASKSSPSQSTGVSTGRSVARASMDRRPASSLVPEPETLRLRSFAAVDFETANRRGGVSACQVALVRVQDGRIVDRFATLLKPPPGWDGFEFTHIHGINGPQVSRAPAWPQICPQVAGFVQGLPVYAHNASFDARVWQELDAYFGTQTLPEQFFCSYRTAARLMPNLDNYQLPTVVHACAPRFRLQHHKADSDAEACAHIVCALQKMA